MPLVSVIIPSYNHEKFVRECIQSVLDQTFQDFEIIITDDASSDRTVEVIEQFDDSRIKLFRHSINQGVSVAANNCIYQASGKYIAWLSTDDAWYPEKLDVQIRYLDEHPDAGVVFGKVDWIDESGKPITSNDFPYLNIFNVLNRTRAEWLRYFFLVGNCLSLPSSLVRSECFAKVGLFNPAYAKIPDLDLWIRICLKYDIAILDQKLIRNRWIGDESNASGNTIKNRTQVQLEHRYSLDHYLEITNPGEFLSIFPDSVKYGEVITSNIPYFLGRIAIDNGWEYKTLWGLDVISRLLKNEDMARVLEEKCNFRYVDFLGLSNECDPFNIQRVERLTEIEQARKQAIETLVAQVEGNRQAIETLTGQIQGLTEQLHEKERELTGIKSSRSWRYTEFLRRIGAKLH